MENQERCLYKIAHITVAIRGAHWPSGKSVGLRIGRPGFDPRPGRCVVSLSKGTFTPQKYW